MTQPGPRRIVLGILALIACAALTVAACATPLAPAPASTPLLPTPPTPCCQQQVQPTLLLPPSPAPSPPSQAPTPSPH